MHVFAFVQICTHKLLDPPQLPHFFSPFRKDHIPLHILKFVYKIDKEKKDYITAFLTMQCHIDIISHTFTFCPSYT